MKIKKRRCVLLCCIFVVVLIIYIMFRHGMDPNISYIVNVIPAKILQMVKQDSFRIPVIVVEEHHEVIPYWFAAAESEILTKKGVTIIHIDGHGDTANPSITDDFPAFTWPAKISHLISLMQQNDVFVMGATTTGFIKRFIWIWPPWDAKNHDSAHSRKVLDIGTTNKLVDGNHVTFLCMCEIQSRKHCFMTNYTHDVDDDVAIPEDQCSFTNKKTLIIEEVSEDEAIQLVQTQSNWINLTEDVLLDIDEDYYGCESVVSDLFNVGITHEVISRVEQIIHTIFCGQAAQQEHDADKFFNYLIHTVTELKHQMTNCKQNTGKCLSFVNIQAILFNKIPDSIEELNKKELVCGDSSAISHVYLQGLLRNLLKLNNTQLYRLARVGVCFSRSPKTYHFEEDMRFCLSYNSPNSTLVLFHTASPSEIQERTNKLQTLLSSKIINSKFITITRSVRDGYTPRHQAVHIESELMKVLIRSFKGVNTDTIHFDPNLLGGSTGWYGRYSKHKNAV